MPLSINVAVYAQHDPDGVKAKIIASSEGAQGELVITWDKFFGRTHTIVTMPPTGGMAIPIKTLRKRSQKQEQKRIEAIGGRVHTGSGALPYRKSDGSTEHWRMENKFTTAQSYSVTLKDLLKLRGECQGYQNPVFNVEFQDKHTGAVKETWVLVPAAAWEKLVNGSSNTQ